MERNMCPVDVISLSSTDGKLRPLRVRASVEDAEAIVGNVYEILTIRENPHVGAESMTFLCRIRLPNATTVAELKFYMRTHSWYMCRPEC